MTYNIIITADTVAKLSDRPVPSTDLPQSKRLPLPQGTVLVIDECLDSADNHLRVSLLSTTTEVRSPKREALTKQSELRTQKNDTATATATATDEPTDEPTEPTDEPTEPTATATATDEPTEPTATEAEVIPLVTTYNRVPVWLYAPHCDATQVPQDAWRIVTASKLRRVYPNTTTELVERYIDSINVALREFSIDTNKRIAAFLAQVGHESGELRYAEEIASGAAYEGRKDLGNVQVGDGKRYKGRGLIQLTGRSNYRACGTALNLPLETNPVLASHPDNAPRIAAWFWASRGLNELADKGNIDSFRTITQRINGGTNGWKDRLRLWDTARAVFP